MFAGIFVGSFLVSDSIIFDWILIVFNITCYELHRMNPLLFEQRRIQNTTGYELDIIIPVWTNRRVGVLLVYDKEWGRRFVSEYY